MENKNFEQLLNELAKIVKILKVEIYHLKSQSISIRKDKFECEVQKRLEQAREVVVTKMTETSEENFN